MARTRRTFTREFKVQAVKLVTEQGYSYAEAARQLGVRDHQLRTWRKQLEAVGGDAFPGVGHRSAVDAELHRLRAENKRLLVERDILKKAAAYFAREST
jgi:transposase